MANFLKSEQSYFGCACIVVLSPYLSATVTILAGHSNVIYVFAIVTNSSLTYVRLQNVTLLQETSLEAAIAQSVEQQISDRKIADCCVDSIPELATRRCVPWKKHLTLLFL